MERGLTLGEIFKVIFKRIWWVLGATVLGLIAAVLISELWYNRETEYYTVSYEIVYPDSGSGKYPDGSDLFAEESISLTTLSDIKNGRYSESNPDEFKGIDVNDMYVDDGISISERVVRSEDGNIKRTYTLTVKAKYFSSQPQAHAFMRTVADYPVNRVKSIMTDKDYVASLSGYGDAPTYDEKISALIAQKNYLESEYSKLSAYGDKAATGIASLRNIFTASQQSEIKAHITAFRYVLNPETYKNGAAAETASLNKQIEDNKKIIEDLRAEQKNSNISSDTSSTVIDPYEDRIAAIIENNGKLQNRIDEINETLTAIESYTAEGAQKDAKQAFDARIDEIRAQLEEAADSLKTVSVSIYNDNSRAVFSSNKIEPQGGLHWAASVILGALVGCILSSIVVCIIDVPRYKRSKLAAPTEEQTASDEEKGAEENTGI